MLTCYGLSLVCSLSWFVLVSVRPDLDLDSNKV